MSEIPRDAFRVSFDRAIQLEFHGAKVNSDAGLFPYRDLNEGAQLPQRPDRASTPPSGGRTRPVTLDSGLEFAKKWCDSGGGARYTRVRKARRWSRAKVRWEMSANAAEHPELQIHGLLDAWQSCDMALDVATTIDSTSNVPVTCTLEYRKTHNYLLNGPTGDTQEYKTMIRYRTTLTRQPNEWEIDQCGGDSSRRRSW